MAIAISLANVRSCRSRVAAGILRLGGDRRTVAISNTGDAIRLAGIRRVGRRVGLALGAAAAVMLATAAVVSGAGFSAVEGTQFSGTIGPISLACVPNPPADPDCSGMSPSFHAGITIKWGDGTTVDTSSGTATKISCDTSCSYAVSGKHTYAEDGSYSVSYSVPNVNVPPGNTQAHGTSAATVADAPLTNPAAASGLSATEGAPATLQLGTFADANPGAGVSDFSATPRVKLGCLAAGSTVPGAGC